MARIIDVIEWTDQASNEMVHREPPAGAGDIRLGSQLIVRPGQIAMFVKDGKALDQFVEGRHTLSTMNIPILASIIGLGTSGKTPFPAEVYFTTTKDFIDLKWGTPGEITVPDSVLGMVQLRAFGTYSIQIANPTQFINQIVGVQGLYTTDDIADYLRGVMLSEIASTLGETMKSKSLLDLAALQNVLGSEIQKQAADDFADLGLKLKKVYVVGIQPNEETAKAISQRGAMGALGVNYVQYQAGQAMREAAQNTSGGAAGTGVGLGAGIGLGQVMADAMRGMNQAPQQPPAPTGGAAGGTASKATIQQALTNLDIRLANGDISEATYNNLRANLQKALDSAQ